MSYQIPLPLGILESLQIVFQSEAKKVCREVAQTLGVSAPDLIRSVLGEAPTSLIQVYDLECPYQCPILLKEGEIYTRCKKSCTLGTERCSEHSSVHQDDPPVDRILRKLRGDDLPESLWVCEKTKEVFNQQGDVVGYVRGHTLYRFEPVQTIQTR